MHYLKEAVDSSIQLALAQMAVEVRDCPESREALQKCEDAYNVAWIRLDTWTEAHIQRKPF